MYKIALLDAIQR